MFRYPTLRLLSTMEETNSLLNSGGVHYTIGNTCSSIALTLLAPLLFSYLARRILISINWIVSFHCYHVVAPALSTFSHSLAAAHSVL